MGKYHTGIWSLGLLSNKLVRPYWDMDMLFRSLGLRLAQGYFTFLIISLSFLNAGPDCLAAEKTCQQKDSARIKQVLFNGKIWRNLYPRVYGTQFLFSTEFLQADISVKGRTFKNIRAKYDIFRDELLTETDNGTIIQMNKEIVDSFSLKYYDMSYFFIRIDSSGDFKGYVNVLYSGESSMYVTYKKLIELLAIDRKQDRFYEKRKMYLVRDGVAEQFSGRSDLLKLFGERKKEVKELIRKNQLLTRRDEPLSFVPLIKLYDKLLIEDRL
jgi:hypothetical protein